MILQAVAAAMDHGDLHILAAMDGAEPTSASRPVAASNRHEPTTFFYVVFGLVYEALVTSSAESTSASSARQTLVISALQALKCLVRPEYSGKVFEEATIFEEFISLCYRIVMTEPASVQVHLVEVISSFASSQGHQTR